MSRKKQKKDSLPSDQFLEEEIESTLFSLHSTLDYLQNLIEQRYDTRNSD